VLATREIMAALGVQVETGRLGGDAWELSVAGELDLHDAPALERALEEAYASGARRLLLDLSSVPFVDSTSLGLLVAASRRFDTFVVAAGDVRVLRLLELTGLDRKLDVERSRAEALAVLTARGFE
jgi:anti-sigma B factor antagonist